MDKIDGIIFDMDGIILDSESICFKTWQIAAKEFNLSNIQIAQTECLGTNKEDTLSILKKIYGQDFDSKVFLDRTSELFFEIEKKEGLKLMPYVIPTLKYLKTKYPLALATSTRKETATRQLINANVINYFKTLTFGDMVKHSKPDPEIYTMACNSLNIKPENCIAVEDSPNGIISAYKAGLRCIMIPDKIKPTTQIEKLCWNICNSMNDLQKIL